MLVIKVDMGNRKNNALYMCVHMYKMSGHIPVFTHHHLTSCIALVI